MRLRLGWVVNLQIFLISNTYPTVFFLFQAWDVMLHFFLCFGMQMYTHYQGVVFLGAVETVCA